MPRKRSNGDGGLYYIPSRRLWRATLEHGFKADGSRNTLTRSARTQAEARRKIAELRRELEAYGDPLDAKTTVTEWAERWLADVCRPAMKPSALAAYESLTRVWIIPTIGTRKVAQLKPADVRTVVKAMLDAGLSSSSARKAYNVLSRMLEQARIEGLCGRNVAKDVAAPKIAVTNRTALPLDDARKVLATAAGDIDGTRWGAALIQGLRQAERLGAQLADLDLDAATLTIAWTLEEITSEHGCGLTANRTWVCGRLRGSSCPDARLKIPLGFEYRRLTGRLCLIRPKSGKARTVPLVPQQVQQFRRYLAVTSTVPNPHGLIWRNQDGSPILPYKDEQDWRVLLNRAGLITDEQTKPPRLRAPGTPAPPPAHSARHTTATLLMEMGVSNKIVGEVVGHQSEKVTQRYQHVSSAAAREAIERVGGILS